MLEEVVHVWEAQPAAREICALRRVQMQERSGGSVDIDDTVAGGMEERGEGTHEFAFEGVKGARGALDGGEVCGMEGVEGQVPEGRGPVDEPVCMHARTHARTHGGALLGQWNGTSVGQTRARTPWNPAASRALRRPASRAARTTLCGVVGGGRRRGGEGGRGREGRVLRRGEICGADSIITPRTRLAASETAVLIPRGCPPLPGCTPHRSV